MLNIEVRRLALSEILTGIFYDINNISVMFGNPFILNNDQEKKNIPGLFSDS